MSSTHLPGLEGTNPLGFLAALGVQVAFESETSHPKLWWSDDVIPHAIVDGDHTVDDIVSQTIRALRLWRNSPPLKPVLEDGSEMPRGDDLKFTYENIRVYLSKNRGCTAEELGFSLVAEGSLDWQGVAKPSDLYFTAGQQKFLSVVNQIISEATESDVRSGLLGPWDYKSELPSLGWDVADDNMHALRARDPSSEKKLTNPGPEALAILGLSTHNVFAGKDRTITRGCSGSWKHGIYSWPIWNRPATFYSVKSLLAHAYMRERDQRRYLWFASWGISKILQSHIRRSNQGGYGTFGPPEIVWQAP